VLPASLQLFRAGNGQVYNTFKDFDDPESRTAHTRIVAFVQNLFCQRVHTSKAASILCSHKPIIMFGHAPQIVGLHSASLFH